MTTVVNIYKSKYDVYIGRAGKGQDGYFGNPYWLNVESQRNEVIAKYKIWFLEKIKNDAVFKLRVLGLKGKTLGCFCKPKACHGDIIIEYLNSCI